MPREIRLDQLSNAHEAVLASVQELEAGRLVAVPDESGWNVLALAISEAASSSLRRLSASEAGLPPAVSVAHPQVVADYVTDAPRLFQKLSARCWPGPVILRSGAVEVEGLARQWPAESQRWGLTEAGRAFYCPAENFAQEVLRSLTAPALSLLRSNSDDLSFAAADLSLIVRAVDRRFSEPPTVVRVNGERFRVEQSGVVSERMLARLAGEVYLFVCTGNTCRSPMAEALFRKMLADRLKCREDELLDRGFVVVSAGLAAYRGSPAAPEAVELLRRQSVDLSAHESQPVTEELLFHCDHIITMTRSHRDAVLSTYPELEKQVRLLSPRGEDISDPIGAGIEEYTRCRDEIASHLQALLESIDFAKK